MLHPLSNFDDDFFDGEKVGYSKYPTSISQAIESMDNNDWNNMIEDLFMDKDVGIGDVMDLIIDTNTCANLDSPVEVWIDPEGFWTLLIYEE